MSESVKKGMGFFTKVTTQLLFLQTKQMAGRTTGSYSLLEDAHNTVKAKYQVSYYSFCQISHPQCVMSSAIQLYLQFWVVTGAKTCIVLKVF